MSCWLAGAQFDRCKASTVVTYARNLRGFCNRKGIDCMEFSSKIWKAFEGGLRAGRSNEVKRSTAVTMQVLARVRPHMRLHDPKQRQRWLHLLLMHDAMLRGGDCTGGASMYALKGACFGSRSTNTSTTARAQLQV